jgi:NitT/TauT family transport system substrate-binding protein
MTAKSLLAGLFCLAALSPSLGAEVLRVGSDAPTSIPDCSTDIGLEHGIFARHGLDVETSTFFGASKGQPALIGGVIDVETGAGSEMAFIVKGAPELAVAKTVGAPADMAIAVRPDSKITDLSQLRGGKVAISNPGGTTEWLAKQVMKREHFAPNELTIVSAGDAASESAVLRTRQVDAAVLDAVTAYSLETKGDARVLMSFGSIAPDFVRGVILARTELIEKRPEVLRAFLAAWFESAHVMLTNEDDAVACILRKIGGDPAVAHRVYHIVQTEMSPTGRFEPQALDALAQSFVDTGVLPGKPDMSKLYTEAFLPKAQ